MNSGLEATIKKYTEQLGVDPKSRAFVPLSDAYRQLGRYEEAIAVAQEGLKNHPTYVSGKISLARAHFENGELEPANLVIEDLLVTSPDNLLVNRIYAEVCIQKNDKDKALKAIQAILDVEPNDVRALKLLATLEPKPPEPTIIPKKEMEPKPAPVIHSATLAELYLSQGHVKEARQVYQDLSQQNPENPKFQEKLKQLEPKAPPVENSKIKVLQQWLLKITERRHSL